MNQPDRLYKWAELADYPDKKFQREDWDNPDSYVYFNEHGVLLDWCGRNHVAKIKDWQLNWREYVE